MFGGEVPPPPPLNRTLQGLGTGEKGQRENEAERKVRAQNKLDRTIIILHKVR